MKTNKMKYFSIYDQKSINCGDVKMSLDKTAILYKNTNANLAISNISKRSNINLHQKSTIVKHNVKSHNMMYTYIF